MAATSDLPVVCGEPTMMDVCRFASDAGDDGWPRPRHLSQHRAASLASAKRPEATAVADLPEPEHPRSDSEPLQDTRGQGSGLALALAHLKPETEVFPSLASGLIQA